MRIWHLDTVGSRDAVDGVASGLWVLAAAQAALGHDVVLFVRTEPDAQTVDAAAADRIELARMSRSLRSPALAIAPFRRPDPPDIYHFHGAWMTYHAVMSSWLRLRGRPYVVTTHGGYGPEVLSSKRRRRAVYVRLFERPHLCGAGAAVTTVVGEDDLVRELVGQSCPIVNAPWPAATDAAPPKWEPDLERPTVVFLGRFDTHQKGLDRLVRIASLCPRITFQLYGLPGRNDGRELKALVRSAPRNVHFNPPVHGDTKRAVLSHAAIYLQPSRFEGFSLSVVDALLAGTPVVASEHLGLTRELKENGAGGALPGDVASAAAYLRNVVADAEQLRAWSTIGPVFAAPRFDPVSSAEAYLAIYRDVIAGNRVLSS